MSFLPLAQCQCGNRACMLHCNLRSSSDGFNNPACQQNLEGQCMVHVVLDMHSGQFPGFRGMPILLYLHKTFARLPQHHCTLRGIILSIAQCRYTFASQAMSSDLSYLERYDETTLTKPWTSTTSLLHHPDIGSEWGFDSNLLSSPPSNQIFCEKRHI